LSGYPTIAVIDDDESVRASLDTLLRSFGFPVQVFASAEAFMAAPDLAGFACAISDVQMGGMNGIELARHMAARHPPLRVILMTAFFDAGVKRRAEDAGAVCLLAKPFNSQDLIACLKLALGRDELF